MSKKKPVVTVAWIQEQLDAIRAQADDDEMAHAMEDSLYMEVLQAIASGRVVDAPACARKALKARAIEFERWCA